MTTPAAVQEAPISTDLDIPDSAVERRAGPWSLDGLRHAVDQLCIRYDLGDSEQLGWEDLGDPESNAFQESAPRLYLAAAALCALRTSSAFPAVAFGAWSATDLAAHLAGAVPPRPLGRDLFTEPPLPQAGPADSLPGQAPIVLVGTLPEAGRFDLLIWDLLLVDPRIEHLADGAAILRAGVHAPALPGETSGLADQPIENPSTECSVVIRASLLLQAVGRGLELLERETGVRVSLGESLVPAFEHWAAPGPAWAAVVPELPSWARTVEALGPTPADTFALWKALAPVPPSPAAEAALRARACLAHQLFALTGYSPALGWAALLSGTTDAVAAVAAARDAGIRILPPTVQSAATIWEHDADASVPRLRAPLCVLEEIASTADAITRSFRLDGPFASVPDLVRRVPATAVSPDTLRSLLDVGALDSLCDREVLSAHWNMVSDWCKDSNASANPEPLVEGVPLFAIPPHVDVAIQETDGWWDRLVKDRATSLAPDPVSFTPPNGTIELNDAGLRERRAWQVDGVDLMVVALRAGERSVHAVTAASTNGGNTQRSIAVQTAKSGGDSAPAVWIDAALVSPPVGQVEVSVPLLGDRDRDLERIRRVKAIIGRYTGDLQVRLALIHGDSRRDLPPAADDKVAWSGELVDDLEMLLGPNSVRLTTSG